MIVKDILKELAKTQKVSISCNSEILEEDTAEVLHINSRFLDCSMECLSVDRSIKNSQIIIEIKTNGVK